MKILKQYRSKEILLQDQVVYADRRNLYVLKKEVQK